MGRKRQPLAACWTGEQFVVYFKHPVSKKTKYLPLGTDRKTAYATVDDLNATFLFPDRWDGLSIQDPRVRAAWLGNSDPETNPKNYGIQNPGEQPTPDEIQFLVDKLEFANAEIKRLNNSVARLSREVEHYRGAPPRDGPCPTIRKALDVWLSAYKASRDAHHFQCVSCDLERFAAEFGPDKLVDHFIGKELEIMRWIDGLRRVSIDPAGNKILGDPLGAKRRREIRLYVLKFLAESGVRLQRERIPGPRLQDLRRDRAPIRWLDRAQAEKVAASLAAAAGAYWEDLFRFQVGTGLRPSELPTVRRANFSADWEVLTLEHLDQTEFTLKTGSRKIQISSEVRKILRRRFKPKRADLLFPDPRTAARWASLDYFHKCYRLRLIAAGKAACVAWDLDCRTARRTCGSLLLRAGSSVEQVAAILGDAPDTIREHYARILSSEVDASAAAI